MKRKGMEEERLIIIKYVVEEKPKSSRSPGWNRIEIRKLKGACRRKTGEWWTLAGPPNGLMGTRCRALWNVFDSGSFKKVLAFFFLQGTLPNFPKSVCPRTGHGPATDPCSSPGNTDAADVAPGIESEG